MVSASAGSLPRGSASGDLHPWGLPRGEEGLYSGNRGSASGGDIDPNCYDFERFKHNW